MHRLLQSTHGAKIHWNRGCTAARSIRVQSHNRARNIGQGIRVFVLQVVYFHDMDQNQEHYVALSYTHDTGRIMPGGTSKGPEEMSVSEAGGGKDIIDSFIQKQKLQIQEGVKKHKASARSATEIVVFD